MRSVYLSPSFYSGNRLCWVILYWTPEAPFSSLFSLPSSHPWENTLCGLHHSLSFLISWLLSGSRQREAARDQAIDSTSLPSAPSPPAYGLAVATCNYLLPLLPLLHWAPLPLAPLCFFRPIDGNGFPLLLVPDRVPVTPATPLAIFPSFSTYP